MVKKGTGSNQYATKPKAPSQIITIDLLTVNIKQLTQDAQTARIQAMQDPKCSPDIIHAAWMANDELPDIWDVMDEDTVENRTPNFGLKIHILNHPNCPDSVLKEAIQHPVNFPPGADFNYVPSSNYKDMAMEVIKTCFHNPNFEFGTQEFESWRRGESLEDYFYNEDELQEALLGAIPEHIRAIVSLAE